LNIFKHANLKNSIQSKIFVWFILVMVLPTALISLSSYFISIEILKNRVSTSYAEMLEYLSNVTERELKQVEQISDCIFISSEIKKVLVADKNEVDSAQFYYEMLEANAVFSNYSIYSNIFSYISAIKVIGENGVQLLYGVDSNNLGHINNNNLKDLWWYKSVINFDGEPFWTGIHANEAGMLFSDDNRYVISLARVIKDDNYLKDNIGIMYISFNNRLFSEMLKDVKLDTKSKIFIIDNFGKLVYNGDDAIACEFPNLREIENTKQKSGYVTGDGSLTR